MDRLNITFLDLPNEILFIILKKLNNMDVLYSFLDVDNQRLDIIVQGKTFTESLNFILTTLTDDIMSIADSVLDRFCNNILPRIDHNLKSLILESSSMERILLAADYPNLTKLKIFNFNDEIASLFFTDESPFRRIFQQQITELILVYESDIDILLDKEYPKGLHVYILTSFEQLNHFSITGSPTVLSLHNLPLTTCSSSSLSKLCVNVNNFEDCLALLDGRLRHLMTFTVFMDYIDYDSSVVYNTDDLPNLKRFSLTCTCVADEYDTQVLPLFRRMSNLEELTLNINNEDRTTIIDGTQINDEILVHMQQLHKFNFHICTEIERNHLVHYLSSDDVQRTFTNIGYHHVGCILKHIGEASICHVFSVPFVFDHLEYIGNIFPSIVFPYVIHLGVHDIVPFKHEFFVRIAHFFPLLKKLRVMNLEAQLQIADKLDTNDNQLYSFLEYPYLVSLCLEHAHIDYVEQFLNQAKTYLPRLTKVSVGYDQLTTVTKNFTRDTTRLNCAKVKQLIINKTLVHSKDFYVYFPLL